MKQTQAHAGFDNRSGENGFSLIEVLISFLLVTMVMLALLEGVVLYSQVNMRNILRDEGVRATQDVLNELRSRDFNRVTAGTSTLTVRKALRSGSWDYTVTLVVTDSPAAPEPPTTKSIQATTRWEFQGKTYTHAANAMITQ